MIEKELRIPMKVCGYEELSPVDRRLVDEARQATRRSFAPYSKFHVGAAILMDNGEIVAGSNQENAAYSSGTCAERSACFYASARYPGVPMRKIAIAAWTMLHDDEAAASDAEAVAAAELPEEVYERFYQPKPISPCGACRQALLEYEALYGNIEVILYGKDEVYILPSVASLLPLCFTEF